mmetsp:Transcript_21524/g.43809  ORF Transcript_21524/g.43809 Transcript_21524/m.43809 type:complete len:265 (-) Transcript_21524:136-930(-)
MANEFHFRLGCLFEINGFFPQMGPSSLIDSARLARLLATQVSLHSVYDPPAWGGSCSSEMLATRLDCTSWAEQMTILSRIFFFTNWRERAIIAEIIIGGFRMINPLSLMGKPSSVIALFRRCSSKLKFFHPIPLPLATITAPSLISLIVDVRHAKKSMVTFNKQSLWYSVSNPYGLAAAKSVYIIGRPRSSLPAAKLDAGQIKSTILDAVAVSMELRSMSASTLRTLVSLAMAFLVSPLHTIAYAASSKRFRGMTSFLRHSSKR